MGLNLGVEHRRVSLPASLPIACSSATSMAPISSKAIAAAASSGRLRGAAGGRGFENCLGYSSKGFPPFLVLVKASSWIFLSRLVSFVLGLNKKILAIAANSEICTNNPWI